MPKTAQTDLDRTLTALKGVNVSSLNRSLVAAAALFVIIFGIRYTAEVTTPLLFGICLAVLIRPIHQKLLNRGLPSSLALVITILGLSAILFALGLFVVGTFRSVQSGLSAYKTELTQQLESLTTGSSELTGSLPPPEQISGAMVSVLSSIISAAASTISTLIIAVVLASMLIIEAPHLKKALSHSVGSQPMVTQGLSNFSRSAIIYFISRTKLNLLTGAGLTVVYFILGVDHPLTWGFLAFILSYIPYIGLVLAMTPPTIITFAESGLTSAIILVAAGIIWNLIIENILQPAYVGQTLKLSPTVVFVSFFIFGWLLGPLGALISMPLTVMLVLFLENYPETRWLANLMGRFPNENP